MLDIFGRKRIEELEAKLRQEESRRRNAEYERNDLIETLKDVGRLRESEPEGCVKGSWCKACEFVKKVSHISYQGFGVSGKTTVYVCGLGNSCKNFVQKKEDK